MNLDPSDLLFPPREWRRLSGDCDPRMAERAEWVQDPGLRLQGFRMDWTPVALRIHHRDAAGKRYAEGLLADLHERVTGGEKIPAFCCEDWPDFTRRGFMLDISRDRVPTMEFLERLVTQLGRLRYNQLQLYTEHTFAYSGHEEVWKNASPMTADEIRQLDRMAAQNGIELVPNQNSFGHMERWLQHTQYRHLAECPNGFNHPDGKWREFGSVLYPDGRAVAFVNGLHRELLGCFSSREMNLGCDETWELGQGRSRERVERQGRAAVYREHVRQVVERALDMGITPMIWADEMIKEGRVDESFPRGVVPVIWGYGEDHPFAEQVERVRRNGFRRFAVAPGSNCWKTFCGRWQVARRNIALACGDGFKGGASDMLLTSWGDNGHQYPSCAMWPSMVYASRNGWQVNGDAGLSLERAMARIFECGVNDARLILECGTLESSMGSPRLNGSLSYQMIAGNDAPEMLRHANAVSPPEWQRWMDGWQSIEEEMSGMSASDVIRMLRWSVSLNRLACRRASHLLKDGWTGLPPVTEEMRAEFRSLWHRESRGGGFEDSLRKLCPGNCEIAKPRNGETAKSRNRETAKRRNCEIAKP